jgi:uncharacterized phiE125 gp8 family phage protein
MGRTPGAAIPLKIYGALELTEASPAQSLTEPITIQQAKEFLRISATTQDFVIQGMIRASRELAEIMQGRDLVLKQYDLTLDMLLGDDATAHPNDSRYSLYSGNEIQLRQPLRSVDLFRYTESDGTVNTLTESTDYVVSTQRGLVTPPYGQIWPFFTPKATSAVLIRFTAGYPRSHTYWQDAGARIVMGMQLCISGWFENRVPYNPDLSGAAQEYPRGVTELFSYGARPRVH